MELDVGTDDVLRDPGQPRIDEQPGEGGRAEMDVVAVGDRGAAALTLSQVASVSPCRSASAWTSAR